MGQQDKKNKEKMYTKSFKTLNSQMLCQLIICGTKCDRDKLIQFPERLGH